MNCQEFVNYLDDFIDSELDDELRTRVRSHLDSCATCQKRYRGSSSLKRLVQTKTYQPTLPGGLAARVLRNVRAEVDRQTPNRFRTVITTLAASVLVFIVFWAFLARGGSPPLAHADVVKEAAERFQSGDTGNPVVDIEAALRTIRRLTRVRLSSFPAIPNAQLVSWSPEDFLGRACVRLAYREAASDASGTPTIVIFAISGDDVDLAPGLHPCRCVKVGDRAIFCFTESGTAMTLVSSLDSTEMEIRLKANY